MNFCHPQILPAGRFSISEIQGPELNGKGHRVTNYGQKYSFGAKSEMEMNEKVN